ncbi:MAG TPA: tetratricopeptide repeat protein, partial [Phototrophicaceae bacterium]|nr:tetratricopeptide repeat protein [Phototrophicaceae bacterium]
LNRARQINRRTPATLHWAQLAEILQAAPAEEIVTAYAEYLPRIVYNRLPLADFWWETDLRRQAVERYLTNKEVKPDWQYRILAAHNPERAAEMVSDTPQTAAEYWIAGEHALTVNQDSTAATAYFTAAIEQARTTGDYYAARARAELRLDPNAARRDLDIATLLTTWAEYPNAIRAELAATPEEAHQRRAEALPPRTTLQEFAATLYGRPAIFDLLPEVRAPGPGRTAMQPWYTLAEEYLQAGKTERALKVYNAILEYAPDETEAQEKRRELSP